MAITGLDWHGALLHNVAELLDAAVLAEAEAEGPPAPAAAKIVTRVPDRIRRTLNPSARRNALQATGAELRCNLAGQPLTLTLASTERPAVVEVYRGDLLDAWHTVQTVPTSIVVEPHERAEQHRLVAEQHLAPGFDSQLVRIALPWRPPVLLLGVDGPITPPRADQLPRRRYLAYGSSITHGNTSIGPGDAYPARLGRMLGVDVLNLGFGGGAHLEPQLADYFAGRDDWDFATLELGVNLMGTLSVAEFTARVEAFLPRLVAAAGQRWIVCTDMFVSRFDMEQPDKAAGFRRAVRETARSLDAANLIQVDGEPLLQWGGLSTDLVHPSPAGFAQIATALAAVLAERCDIHPAARTG